MPTPWKLPHAHPAIPGGGRVLTPADREFHRYGSPAVWGELATEELHNPFRDFDFEDRGRDSADDEDRIYHGWDHAADAHPGYVKDFHERYARHVGKAHPAMAVPTYAVSQIVKDQRLKSQFETGKSLEGGETDTEGRAMVEHHQFGYPEDHPEHARPIYGYLSANPFTDTSAAGYGHTTFVLHKPHIWHRTTFSGDDSWGGMGKISPVSVGDYTADPHSYRHAVPVNHLGFDTEEAHRLAGHSLGRRMEERAPAERADAFWRGTDRDRDHFPYPEAQYHGGVGLHAVRYAIVRSADTGGDPTSMSSSSREATRALTAAGIPWIHTVGYRKPRTSDHAFMNDEKHRPLPPEMPYSMHRGANLLTDLAQPIFERQVRFQRPGGGGWLLHDTTPGPGGEPMARAIDTEWGVSGRKPLASYLARGYWQPLEEPVDSRDVLSVCRKAGAR